MSTRHTFRDAVADYLRQHANTWIPAIAFERVGGRQGWRTRLSDCRRELGMQIDNRVRTVKMPDGTKYRLSEYRLVVNAGRLPFEDVA